MEQPARDIALHLSKQHRLNYQDIAEVLIKTYELAAKTARSMRTDASRSFTVCQFTMSYAVAGALIFGNVGSEQFRRTIFWERQRPSKR
ncbi:MAG: MmgE/PrpD family protein [Betaproteobacteria bacterium]|nr:MmgE/PrpD family protein [Betaproteobacteria bacterium]